MKDKMALNLMCWHNYKGILVNKKNGTLLSYYLHVVDV